MIAMRHLGLLLWMLLLVLVLASGVWHLLLQLLDVLVDVQDLDPGLAPVLFQGRNHVIADLHPLRMVPKVR